MFTVGPAFWGGGDPFGANVALLMHFDGGFTDSSSYGQTITTTGSPTISGSAPAFGSGSADFTGGADQYASASGASLSPGTGQFTLELQLKPTSLYPGGAGYFFHWGTSPNDIYIWAQFGVAQMQVLGNGIAVPSIVANAWNQITILRDATNAKVFIGATQIFSTASSNDMGAAATINVGAYPAVNKGTSFIDEVRLTIGVARTPEIQTAPFPNP